MRNIVWLFLSVALLGGAPRADARPAEPMSKQVLGRVTLQGDGWARLPASELAKIGRTATHVAVWRRGARVPSLADGADLVFLAVDTAGPHGRNAVYELRAAPPPGDPPPPAAAFADDSSEAPSLTKDRHRYAPDHFLGPVAASRRVVYDADIPVWYAAMLMRGRVVALRVGDDRGTPRGPQTISVRVVGTHAGKISLKAKWGAQDLGEAEAETAAGGVTLTWTVPEPTSAPALMLEDTSPTMPPKVRNDVTRTRGRIWIDEVTIEGEVEVPTDFGTKALAAIDVQGTDGLRVDATPRFVALVAADATRTSPLRSTEAGRLRPHRPGTLYAGPATRTVTCTPSPDTPHPLIAAGRARHVILATPPLLTEARRLAAHRNAHGVTSAVVPVVDVYNTYDAGHHTPRAIRQFVLALLGREGAPLDYLLLCGDATFNRTDLIPQVTIPTPMARTKYNGATAADRLYVRPRDGGAVGGPALGRLPFRKPDDLKVFVDRLIRYETEPRADLSRNMLQFITSEGRFGALIDNMLERAFRMVVAQELDLAYDIEITFANTRSPFLWPPPEFNDKVLKALNDGSLFFTYVGHGFAEGFDTLRVGGKFFPILNMEHVDRVAVTGTPPVLFILACTTAMFDGKNDGIGEALLKRPAGPIAFWGATRICHPGANTLLGHAIAHFMTQDAKTGRLGDVLAKARDYSLDHKPKGMLHTMLLTGVGMSIVGEEISRERLALEGSLMFTLLGDPATKLAAPRGGVSVAAKGDGSDVVVEAAGDFPDGTKALVRVEFPRNKDPVKPEPVTNPLDPAQFPTIRKNHRGMNHRIVADLETVFRGGKFTARLLTGGITPGWVVKVIVTNGNQIHHGSTVLE